MVFLLTLLFLKVKLTSLKFPKCKKDVICGTRETAIKDFTKFINTTPRESKYVKECPKPPKLTQIKEF